MRRHDGKYCRVDCAELVQREGTERQSAVTSRQAADTLLAEKDQPWLGWAQNWAQSRTQSEPRIEIAL